MPKKVIDLKSNNFKASSVRESNPNERFILCNSCGNVMIATFEGDEIAYLKATPEEDNEETRAMMAEARKLFSLSGSQGLEEKLKLEDDKETKPACTEAFDAEKDECILCNSCQGCCGETDQACFERRANAAASKEELIQEAEAAIEPEKTEDVKEDPASECCGCGKCHHEDPIEDLHVRDDIVLKLSIWGRVKQVVKLLFNKK
jgi:hypothetical protein